MMVLKPNQRADDGVIAENIDWFPTDLMPTDATSTSIVNAGDVVQAARIRVGAMLSNAAFEHGASGPGWFMRGISLAVADAYDLKDLEKGQASVLQGTRNAFAERKQNIARTTERTISEIMDRLCAVMTMEGIEVPQGYAIQVNMVSSTVQPVSTETNPAKTIPSCRDD